MSLVSLTFGKGKQDFSVRAPIKITQPYESFHAKAGEENKLEVVKVCKFYKLDDIYVVGKIVSGVVGENMAAVVNGKNCQVLELTCKYKGAPIAGSGMTVGVMLRGAESSAIERGGLLQFVGAG
ncbi:MAG: hypothetical protein V1676_07680 [Candidatus Diapherotrites archaeon]